MPQWDPPTYLRFADERSRPFRDLLAQVECADPAYVVDLGCGPGQLTAALAERWPSAEVVGIDSSRPMIKQAQLIEHQRSHATGRLRFELADLRTWRSPQPVDVLVSNATLQWVPDHRARLPSLLRGLAPAGILAFQVPAAGHPAHQLLHTLAAEDPYAPHTAGVERTYAAEPADYLDDLVRTGCSVNAWETTYHHVLAGADPVFTWFSGTGARPVLQSLPAELRPGFEAAYRARLRQAYPPGPGGTVLPFRRIFVVARRAERSGA